MSEPQQDPSSPAAAQLPSRRAGRTRVLNLIGVALPLAAIAWGIYWFSYSRFIEDTEDAYVKADNVTVSPKVGGYVEEVFVGDNQLVKKGDALVRLDRRQYQAVQDRATASIASLHADLDRIQALITQEEAQLAQTRAQQQVSRVAARHAEEELKRYAPLGSTGATTEEQLAQLKATRDQADAQLGAADASVKAAQGRLEESRAQLEGTRAQVKAAEADLRRSKLDLDDTVLRSTLDGRVGDRGVRVGQLVQPGTRMMTIVPVSDLYVVANFKETQLGRMRVGQPVRLRVDALPDLELRGHIESFAPGTGSEFALLPPENATGNFTKIVQRVPVRIRLEKTELPPTMVPGMSVRTEVDTRADGASHG